MDPIYLDYNATTPIDPRVVDAMLPYLSDHYGNPSSNHAYGKKTKAAVDTARAQVADLIGAETDEIIFTGGGSESNNQALKGVVEAGSYGLIRKWLGNRGGKHIITSVIEHPAITLPCHYLERRGCRVTRLRVDRDGIVSVDDLRSCIRGASLVTVMHSNNEVGSIQPIGEIAEICKEHRVLCHSDAAQSMGKLDVNVNKLGVDLLSIAGHKLYAPKGVGALYIRRGVKIDSLIHGAGHEQGRRAGTENVAYIVALGEACKLAKESLSATTVKLRALRDRLWESLQTGLGDRVRLNGHPEHRLPNTLNVNFLDFIGADLLDAVPEIAASTGSACHEGQVQLSAVLKAMGVSPQHGRGAVRLSVGRFTTEEQVDKASEALVRACRNSAVTTETG